MTHWVGSISLDQRDNWDICKQESLFGSNTQTALGVRAGDELFIWGSRQGWLARCRVTQDARRPRGVDEVPWPDPERYTALIPIEVLDEPASPLFMSGGEIEQSVGIGTIQLPRFPRVDAHRAQQLTILLSEAYGRPDRTPGPSPVRQNEPADAAETLLLRGLDDLKVDRQLGRPAPYQQLVLLWAIAEAARGNDRLRSFSSAADELRALIRPFAVGETAPDPELPWSALRRSSWWSISPQPDGPVSRGGRDFIRTEDPVGGLTSDVWRRVRTDLAFRQRVIEKLTAPLSGHPSLEPVLESLFSAQQSRGDDTDAADLLRGLEGLQLRTINGQVNQVLGVEPPNVLVATEKSPLGQPVPIVDVQRALDLLRRDGSVTVDVQTLGYRSSFIGAVLSAQPGVAVSGSPPVVSLSRSVGRGDAGATAGTASTRDVPAGQDDSEADSQGTAPRPRSTGRHFGELPGSPVGSSWATRAEVAQAGVHRPLQGGISGTKADGADSIVVSGGYEDDRDDGDEILYTGAGGNDPATGRQVADQTLDQPGNAGLVTSQNQGLPVRVIRGAKGEHEHSPRSGYRYDGLYRVVDHWSKVGKSGFRVWQFRLKRLSEQDAAPYVPAENVPAGRRRPGMSEGVTTRVIRDTSVSRWVKKLYEGACQVCGVRLEIPGGTLSEGAHIRALGRPHSGPDTVDNVLCLCPNHHALFDSGGIYVTDDMFVYDFNNSFIGTLVTRDRHAIDVAHLQAHRARWGY